MTASLLGVCLAALGVAGPCDESPHVTALRAAPGGTREAAADDFWRHVAIAGTPLVEVRADGNARVTFLWKEPPADEAVNVGLVGSFVPGGSRELVPLARIPGTDVLAATVIVDARARYRYYLAWPQGRLADTRALSRLTLNGLAYELFDDPRSRLAFPDEFDGTRVRTSYFDGPAAAPEPWLTPDPQVARGTLHTFDVTSQRLGNTRPVSVYTPPGYEKSRARLPLFLLFDGEDYLKSVPTVSMLDNLIARGALPQLVVVFLSPIDRAHRSEELAPNARFAEFVVGELLPQVHSQFRVAHDPRKVVVGGSSLGGLASAYLAYQHPEVFGNVLSMSGSYWWYPRESAEDDEATAQAASGWLPRLYKARARVPTRIYASVGLGEGAGMLTPNRQFRDVLISRDVALRYDEFHGDHSYLNWRDNLVDGLSFLLGRL